MIDAEKGHGEGMALLDEVRPLETVIDELIDTLGDHSSESAGSGQRVIWVNSDSLPELEEPSTLSAADLNDEQIGALKGLLSVQLPRALRNWTVDDRWNDLLTAGMLTEQLQFSMYRRRSSSHTAADFDASLNVYNFGPMLDHRQVETIRRCLELYTQVYNTDVFKRYASLLIHPDRHLPENFFADTDIAIGMVSYGVGYIGLSQAGLRLDTNTRFPNSPLGSFKLPVMESTLLHEFGHVHNQESPQKTKPEVVGWSKNQRGEYEQYRWSKAWSPRKYSDKSFDEYGADQFVVFHAAPETQMPVVRDEMIKRLLFPAVPIARSYCSVDYVDVETPEMHVPAVPAGLQLRIADTQTTKVGV